MILDTGICTVFREADVAEAGYMPRKAWEVIGKSWYRELSFSTEPTRETERRLETRIDQRIRVHQMRMIRKEDRVVLADVSEYPTGSAQGEPTIYRITRAYHGQDDDSPALISDLALVEVSP